MTDLLNAEAAARRLGVSVATLSRWRSTRQYIPFVQIGSTYRYDPADIANAIKKVEVAA